MSYNYKIEMREDVRDAILEILKDKCFYDRADLEDYCYDTLWNDDTITGNLSGSYWETEQEAEDAVSDNLCLLIEALFEFNYTIEKLRDANVTLLDVIIRCYMLPAVIDEVIDDLEAKNKIDYIED